MKEEITMTIANAELNKKAESNADYEDMLMKTLLSCLDIQTGE